MTEKPKKLQPALIGGAVIGVLSVVPIISIGCCLWGLIGGAVAAYMLVKRSPVFRVTNGDGTAVGLLAGLFGSVVMIAINVPVSLMRWDQVLAEFRQRAATTNDPNSQETIKSVVAYFQHNPLLSALLIWFLIAIVIIGLAALGGLIGVAIFERRKTPPGPPPGYPPQYYPPQGLPPGYPPQGQPPYGGQTPPQGQPPYGSDTPPY